MKRIILSLAIAILAIGCQARTYYVGGDISLLPEYEKAGSIYFDHEGNPIASFLPWCHNQGMNAMRVRLFVNPATFKTLHAADYDPNACQDLEYILPLCRDIVDSGMDLMLDFHYSDTWADPAKQWTPAEWENLTDEQLYQQIYDYTRQTLETLKENGIVPTFIQPGNEISYGMLWGKYNSSSPRKVLMGNDANWERFGHLLNRAIEACHGVCPDAKIVIHTERAQQPAVLTNFYDKLNEMKVEYDIIGLSFYPCWHGDMQVLDTALTTLENRYADKEIMVVETGYGLKWQLPGADHDTTGTWPISDAGQAAFARDLVECLEKHSNVTGLFWWWMEYNPYGTDLQGWYNAPLFDPSTGRASSALAAICAFADDSALPGVFTDEVQIQWYDLQGRAIPADTPGLRISRGHKSIRTK